MKLQDLAKIEFNFPQNTAEEDTISEYSGFENSTYKVISRIAFLIGVEKRIFEMSHEPPQIEIYNHLHKDKNARIIRNLCLLRNAIERHYSKIYKAMSTELKNLHTMPEYIPQDAITELEQDGITIIKANTKPLNYIIEINKQINNRINNCRSLLPIWLKWEYVRPLFIMPNGTTEEGAKKAGDEYYANMNTYPYQVYINWGGGKKNGNILYNDKKFVSLLYESNKDTFWDMSKVTDAGNVTKQGIYSFLENSHKTAIVVDCENSDPYKVHAMLSNLNQEALLPKICKIVLYDDVHTTSAWSVLNEFTEIPVEHRVIARIKEEKSLVDATLMLGAAKDFYKNEVDSFILLSSDSDYWSLIRELEDARFFVMVESTKCGSDIKRALVNSGVTFCYLDDFCTGDSGIVIRTLLADVKAAIDSSINLNVKQLLDDAIYRTRADISLAEKKQFYDRYLKTMRLEISSEGDLKIKLNNFNS